MAPFSFGDKPLHTGQSTTVTCSITEGDVPLTLSWLLNGHRIESDREDITLIFTKRSAVLTIDSVVGEHAGKYTCMAQNAAGVAQTTTELIVNGWSFC